MTLQPAPAHEHVGAPLQTTEQLPLQNVILHVLAEWHVSVQLPPGHCVAHVVAVQSCVQPPGAAQFIEHDAEPLHVCVQAPPQDSAHVDASPHVYLHAPPSGQLSAHAVLGGQSHAQGAPEVGPQTKP